MRHTLPNFKHFNSLIQLVTHFRDERTCKDFIVRHRWADGDITCPYCGKHHCPMRKDGRFYCKDCNRHFSEKVGTVFEDTKLPLRKWFMAIYLVSSHKKGISSCQLARDVKITQKTAWYILQKIRSLFAQDDSMALQEAVECDEMYYGGREGNKHRNRRTEGTQGRSTKTKTPVFGMAERGGNVVALKLADTKSRTLYPVIRQFVEAGSRIYTDEYIGYKSLAESEYRHSFVTHKDREFVNGETSTNTIEGFWGQLKRSIFGIYHCVSARYLQRYIDESVFRYNTRKMEEGERFLQLLDKSLRVFSYLDVRDIA